MTEAETKVRPVSLNKAIYRDKDDDKWYWTMTPFNPRSSRPIGPFKSREDARTDFRNVMGMRRNTEK